MNIEDRISQLVRDAIEPMLAERLDHMEERLLERLAVVQIPASSPPSLLTQKEVARFLNVAPRTLQRMVSAGEFPVPIPISAGRSRWRQSDLDTWLENR